MSTSYSSIRKRAVSPSPVAALFPATTFDLLNHPAAEADFVRVTRACARKKGLDADEIQQESALKALTDGKVIKDSAHWVCYAALIAMHCCADEWRRRLRHGGSPLSLSPGEEDGFASTEAMASFCLAQEIKCEREADRLLRVMVQALERTASPGVLPAPAARVLKALLELKDDPKSYKKNGRLNGNAIARLAGIPQSTISRQLPVIQKKAQEVLREVEDLWEMDIG